MGWAYFDSSALVKRYVDEPGRREVLRLLRRSNCVVSALFGVELRSAVRRRVADGSLDAKRVPGLFARFARDRQFWTTVALSTEVLSLAESLVAVHPLRSLDSLHVGSAQLMFTRLGDTAELSFVTADGRQADAARAIGLTTRFIDG
jgi:predicted nucleic acid-binding protein